MPRPLHHSPAPAFDPHTPSLRPFDHRSAHRGVQRVVSARGVVLVALLLSALCSPRRRVRGTYGPRMGPAVAGQTHGAPTARPTPVVPTQSWASDLLACAWEEDRDRVLPVLEQCKTAQLSVRKRHAERRQRPQADGPGTTQFGPLVGTISRESGWFLVSPWSVSLWSIGGRGVAPVQR